jgi:hypothetical protein
MNYFLLGCAISTTIAGAYLAYLYFSSRHQEAVGAEYIEMVTRSVMRCKRECELLKSNLWRVTAQRDELNQKMEALNNMRVIDMTQSRERVSL